MANEYASYINKLKDFLNDDLNFINCSKAIDESNPVFSINQKYLKKIFDHDWIDIIEDCLPSLDTIVRNPRRFITVEEDIIDVSLAKQISVESVKHLAQHTQFIASVDENKGTVTPSRILNTSKEESFEVYENRFIFTLIKKLYDFVSKRYEMIQKSVVGSSNQVSVNLTTNYKYKGSTVKVKLETSTEIPYEEQDSSKNADYLTIERVKKMHQIIQGFLSSPFAKEMKNSAPVRPPITRTNVIKKEPNFKKALVLWQFIESYDKTGFDSEEVEESSTLPENLNEQYHQLLFLNDIFMNGFSSLQQDGESIEDISTKLDSLTKGEDIELSNKGEEQDNFPSISLDLKEVRKVYIKSNGDKLYNMGQYREFTACLDRVITQYDLNHMKKDQEERRKLILQQKKEDKRVKALMEKERKLEEARRKKEEENIILSIKKKEQEKIREEKRKLILQQEEIKKRAQEKMEEISQRMEFDEKIKAFRKELESKLQEKLEKYEQTEENLVQMDVTNRKLDLKNDIKKFKREQLSKLKELLDKDLQEYEEDKEVESKEDQEKIEN